MLEIIPLKTKIFNPPQEDIFPELLEVLAQGSIKEGDIVIITSKIVSIHEGRSIPIGDVKDKEELVKSESDWYFPAGEHNKWSLSFAYNTLIFAAGIDESNANGHYILLPKDSNQSAKDIREVLLKKFSLEKIGVIIIDSHCVPFRKGSIGVALGSAGIRPVTEFTGKKDLFGRPFEHTRINVVDSIATTATYVMGETDEQTPVCIVRDAPHITFTDEDCANDVIISPEEDMYYPLIKDVKN